jgi:hypothetical protein
MRPNFNPLNLRSFKLSSLGSLRGQMGKGGLAEKPSRLRCWGQVEAEGGLLLYFPTGNSMHRIAQSEGRCLKCDMVYKG